MPTSQEYFFGSLRAPIGEIVVVASDKGVRNVMFDPDGLPTGVGPDDIVRRPSHAVVASALAQLREYFSGSRTEFDLPVDLHGTEFQVAAWRALARVKFGETASYKRQAAIIGRPTATRAVGAANGKNPVAIVLPCHRIVGSDGSLTGFAGGLGTKQWLLDHEQRVLGSCRRQGRGR